MGNVLGRLIVVGALAGGGCGQRGPAVIGFAFSVESPSVLDVARADMAPPAPQIQTAAGLTQDLGPPAQIAIASALVATPGIVGVVGHGDSRGSILAAPVYNEARIPLVVPTGTSRRLRSAGPWVFMLAPDDSAEAEFIAAFAARSLRARTAAVFYENDDYGIGLRDALRGTLTARGVRVLAEEAIGPVCDPDPLPGAASIIRATPRRFPPDLVILASRTRSAACLGARVRERIPGVRFIAADGVEPDSQFVRTLGTAADAVYVVAFWHPAAPGPRSARFVQAYWRIVGRAPSAGQAMMFDAVMVLDQATRAVGHRPGAVRRYLQELGSTRPVYDGVTGSVAFGRGRQRPLYMLRLRHGVAGPVAVPVP